MIKKLINSWLIQLFCIVWALFLFLDYFNNSGYFLEAFKYFEYSDLLITLIIFVAVISYFLSDRKKSGIVLEIRNFRGVYHYAFVLFVMFLTMIFYISKTGISSSALSGAFIFLFRTIGFHLGVAIIFLSALSIGFYILEKLPLTLGATSSALVGIALGLFVITMGLFLLGTLGLLYQFVVIPFIILMAIPGWKKSFGFIRDALFKKSEPFRVHALAILAYAFILLLIAITFTFDTRTFPLGYDGLGLYMNVPKLLSGYHSLVHGGDAYNWSIIMSLGFIMYNNATITILISVLPGILCLFVIYKICTDLKINRSWSLFACALFYSLPNTIWQSKNDEKTDFALLFITLCCVLLFTGTSNILKKPAGKNKILLNYSPEMILWAIAGCLIGFTFGIKYVALLSIFAFLVVLFYTNSGKYGAIAIFFLNFAVIFGLDLTRFAAFETDNKFFLFLIPFVFAVVSIIIAMGKNKSGMLLASKKAFVFCIAIGITFIPWAIKNTIENKQISFDSMLSGKSPLPDLYSELPKASEKLNTDSPIQTALLSIARISKINYAGFGLTAFRVKTAEDSANWKRKRGISDIRDRAIISSSTNNEKEEEIRRYLGYEKGLIRFMSLPYDLVMKTNTSLASSDLGILALILIPVFVFIFSIRQLQWNILKMVLLLFILVVSVISVQLMKGSAEYWTVLESVKANSFSGTPELRELLLPVYTFLLHPLLLFEIYLMPVYKYLTIQSLGICFILITVSSFILYFIFKGVLNELDIISKSLVAFVFCILQYWLVLSSGIIWYGIVGFSLIPVIVALIANREGAELNQNRFIKGYVVVCASIWFILITPFQFMPTKFLYETDKSKIKFKEFIDVPFAKYAIGAMDENEVFKQFFSQTKLNIIKTINRDKNSKIINVSTFLNYFIVNNDSRVFKDNQLGIFKEIYSRAKNDKTLLAEEFKKNKIKYVLVSLKTADIDKTPDKSLTKKFNDLMNALVNNPEVQLLHTNRIVERPDGDMDIPVNGVVVKAKYDVIGKSVIDPGSDALFEIL